MKFLSFLVCSWLFMALSTNRCDSFRLFGKKDKPKQNDDDGDQPDNDDDEEEADQYDESDSQVGPLPTQTNQPDNGFGGDRQDSGRFTGGGGDEPTAKKDKKKSKNKDKNQVGGKTDEKQPKKGQKASQKGPKRAKTPGTKSTDKSVKPKTNKIKTNRAGMKNPGGRKQVKPFKYTKPKQVRPDRPKTSYGNRIGGQQKQQQKVKTPPKSVGYKKSSYQQRPAISSFRKG